MKTVNSRSRNCWLIAGCRLSPFYRPTVARQWGIIWWTFGLKTDLISTKRLKGSGLWVGNRLKEVYLEQQRIHFLSTLFCFAGWFQRTLSHSMNQESSALRKKKWFLKNRTWWIFVPHRFQGKNKWFWLVVFSSNHTQLTRFEKI